MKPKAYWNPYVAGVLLGLVLLAAFLVAGNGLGATAPPKRALAVATNGIAPAIDAARAGWGVTRVLSYQVRDALATGELIEILRHVGDGKLAPVIGATLPWTEVAEGHRMLEERSVFGKVVLTVSSD